MIRKKIKLNVSGAPFSVGDTVKVIQCTDETLSPRYIGREGKVIYFDYFCGCGQSYPNDPMIGVEFKRNSIEEFWKEELVLTSQLDTYHLDKLNTLPYNY